MAFYQLIRTQRLPVSPAEIWEFISAPSNLKEITPGYMGFEVTRNTGEGRMYAGMIITYRVRPLWGIPLNWMTEITHVKEFEYFVDEQRIGPYSLWHHEHRIEAIEGGVQMTDTVTYRPPFGILGVVAHAWFIKRQLKAIFAYRTEALERRFGTF